MASNSRYELKAGCRMQYNKIGAVMRHQTRQVIKNDRTARQYYAVQGKFVEWLKNESRWHTDRIPPQDYKTAIQGYIDMRTIKCSPATIKHDIASLCAGVGHNMSEYVRPKVHIGEQTKGRQGIASGYRTASEHSRVKSIASAIGCRKEEYADLRGRDLVERNGTMFVRIENGKGGKENLYPIAEKDEERVRAFFGDTKRDAYVLTMQERKEIVHFNLHENRREYVRAQYDAFKSASNEQREAMREFMRQKFLENPRKGASAWCDAQKRIAQAPEYKTKGSIRADMLAKGLPTSYDREALLYASICSAHYREDIVAQHYMR